MADSKERKKEALDFVGPPPLLLPLLIVSVETLLQIHGERE